MPGSSNLNYTIAIVVALALSVILVILAISLVVGLYHSDLDSTIVLRIIQPAFQTIIGGFIGLLTGIKLSGK